MLPAETVHPASIPAPSHSFSLGGRSLSSDINQPFVLFFTLVLRIPRPGRGVRRFLLPQTFNFQLLTFADPGCLPSCKQIAPSTPLESTLPSAPVSVGNKGLVAIKSRLQPLCYQHLKSPLVCVANTGLITPLESALTKNAPVTLLESALTKNTRGGGHL